MDKQHNIPEKAFHHQVSVNEDPNDMSGMSFDESLAQAKQAFSSMKRMKNTASFRKADFRNRTYSL